MLQLLSRKSFSEHWNLYIQICSEITVFMLSKSKTLSWFIKKSIMCLNFLLQLNVIGFSALYMAKHEQEVRLPDLFKGSILWRGQELEIALDKYECFNPLFSCSTPQIEDSGVLSAFCWPSCLWWSSSSWFFEQHPHYSSPVWVRSLQLRCSEARERTTKPFRLYLQSIIR